VSVAKAQVVAANDDVALITPEFMDRIAAEVFRGVVAAVQGALRGEATPTPETSDVMTADDVAVFLGVDRTTVYDFAGRGVIPHQRLGKRLLFRRGALVSWLDSSLCKAASTRKG
jgi:excisionase family DNA binding protein